MNYWIIGTLILSLISPISYTRSMVSGKSKPHRVTRFIVWLASLAGILGVLQSDNLAGQIFALIFFLRATYLLGMSLKFGVGGSNTLDKICLGLGLLALLAYLTTQNGILTISLGILADLIGYIPTFVKTYHEPKSEDPLFFSLEGIASLFAIFAIWQFRADILFPIYFTLSSATVVILIYRKTIFPFWK
ncbi:MAG: hypothetical protein WCI47_00335 [bacterium]